MNTLVDQIIDICRVLGFYAERLGRLRSIKKPADDLTRGYLSADSAEMAYRALSPWYKLAEPLYAELESLMQTASPREVKDVLNDPVIVRSLGLLHQIRAAYEFDKESEEAERLLSLENPGQALDDILKHQSYWIVTPLVLDVVKNAKELAVVGSGPLPLTALALAQSTNAHVTCFEADEKGFEIGRKIIKEAGLADRITSLHQLAEPGSDLEKFDGIFCAVLLGVDVNSPRHMVKRETLLGFLAGMNPASSILIRDPFQLGGLFYPSAAFEKEDPVQIQRHDPKPAKGEPYRSSFLILNKDERNG